MKACGITIFVLCTLLLEGQGGFRSRIWLPGATDHAAKAVFESTPGNYIAAGFTPDTTGGEVKNMITTMGLDSEGKLQWHKQYGSSKFFYFTNQFITRSYYKQGNYLYYAGCARDTSNKQIGVLIKFDLNGDTVWQKIYRDPDPLEDVIPQMVAGSVDGGFLITGFFQHWGSAGGTKCLLIKTDAFGNELWRRKISKAAPNVQDGKAIVQDSVSKKIVIAGYQYLTPSGVFGNVLVLDSLGNELAHKAYVQGHFLDLLQLPDKSFIVCGKTERTTTENETFYTGYVARFSSTPGSFPIWMKKLGPEAHSAGASCLKLLPDGDFLVIGFLGIRDTVHYMTHNRIRMVKMDSLGNIKSDKLYNYKDNAANSHYYVNPNSIELTSDGGWVTALELFHNPRPNPFFFVKYDSTGCDSSAAYCQSLVAGVGEPASGRSSHFDLFPNPASSSVEIATGSTLQKPHTIHITDISGKTVQVVRTTSDEEFLDIRGLQAGLYFVSLYDNTTLLGTRKLVVQR